MGANSLSTPPSDRCIALHDILEMLICMRKHETDQLTVTSLDRLIEGARNAQANLKKTRRQQLEVLEAFEALLALLDAASESPMRLGGLMCLLAGQVERLEASIEQLDVAIH